MDKVMVFKIFVMVILGGVSTFYINHKLKKGPVFASAIVTFFSGIVLPFLFKDSGLTMAAATAAGSYIGMSGKEQIQNSMEIIVASIFLSTLFVISNDVFIGIGGKLGTMACISVMALYGIKTLSSNIMFKGNGKPKDLDIRNN